MDSLYQYSINVILTNQKKSGAILASPNFPIYQYTWFRDGSFSAHALLLAGYPTEAGQFHLWAAQVILRFRGKMEGCIANAKAGKALVASECLHSRFSTDGLEVPGNWGHHQLDGLGTWLWALGAFLEHAQSTAGYESCLQAAGLAAEYLAALWPQPCSDCWEEHETLQHTYTLAAVYAGIRSYARLTRDPGMDREADKIKQFMLTSCRSGGYFVKSIGLPAVDANLLGLCVPYAVVPWTDEVYQATLAKIKSELATPGLHRYAADTYYGSGEWVLLTAWLGWAYAEAGLVEQAKEIAAWIENQQDTHGNLPEQIPHGLFDEPAYETWLQRWGPIATPLVWSHASYVILMKAIQAAEQRRSSADD